ncbi:MAG: hypothetical protein JXN65_10355 [Clostridia bacterium]|nr:hypothetical protein [Clostridia bacterium]
MARTYEYIEVDTADLFLDAENPRFASSDLVKRSTKEITQESIIEHLLKYADVINLAKRIVETKELHGAELITCVLNDGKYIVVEGNRRLCACKLLLDRELIPDNYKRHYPILDDETKDNIKRTTVALYTDRESVQAFLSDRHISGVRKWSALEKNNYYMGLFNSNGKNLDNVKKHTTEHTQTVKNCIIKYQFFINVFDVLKAKYPDIEIENIDYLPMVDRFMWTLIGNDEDVGLGIALDETELQVIIPHEQKNIYSDILLLLGEAFLIRKEQRYCSDGEISKIVSSEIYNKRQQKKLILEDIRITGLIDLINQFNEAKPKEAVLQPSTNDEDESSENHDSTPTMSENPQENTDNDPENDDIYSPPHTPFKLSRKKLGFTEDQFMSFNVDFSSEIGEKINNILVEISSLDVYKYPISCAFLYRALIEQSTKYVYNKHSQTLKKGYDEKDVTSNALYITNQFLFESQGHKAQKNKKSIKGYFSSENIIDTLNLYIHHSYAVDEQKLISTWNTMKHYIIACLSR